MTLRAPPVECRVRRLQARIACPAARPAAKADAKITVLMESVTHHIEEEEQDWFRRDAPGSAANGCRDLEPSSKAGPEEGAYLACPSPVR